MCVNLFVYSGTQWTKNLKTARKVTNRLTFDRLISCQNDWSWHQAESDVYCKLWNSGLMSRLDISESLVVTHKLNHLGGQIMNPHCWWRITVSLCHAVLFVCLTTQTSRDIAQQYVVGQTWRNKVEIGRPVGHQSGPQPWPEIVLIYKQQKPEHHHPTFQPV